MLGLKPSRRTFGYEIVDLAVEGYGKVQWAEWSNPKARPQPRLGDLEALARFIEPGDFVIDLGAHVGDTSLAPALLAGATGLVLSLEPNPATFAILEANARLNEGKASIVALNAAAMPEDREYVFQYNDPSLINGGYQDGISVRDHASFFKVPVRGINLAKYLLANYADRLAQLKFIKTDLEGGDYEAFKTLREIAASYMPVIQSEMFGYRSREDRRSQVTELREMGYELLALTGTTLEGLQKLTPKQVDADRTFDILAIPPRYKDEFAAVGS